MKKYLKVFGIVSGISGILLIGVITASSYLIDIR